jgi:hypothetical protein
MLSLKCRNVCAAGLYIVGMDGNLVLCPHQIDSSEAAAIKELVGEIMDVGDEKIGL